MMNIPKLYKYCRFNDNLVPSVKAHDNRIPQWQSILFEGVLLAKSPASFNDPFDCDFLLEDSFLYQKTAKTIIIETIENDFSLSEQDKKKIYETDNIRSTIEQIVHMPFSDSFEQSLLEGINGIMKELKESMRVMCFSECNNSILMWSHYAENHQGFCVEYDFNNTRIEKSIRKVNYSNIRKHIPSTFADGDAKTANELIYAAACRKSSEWSYEKEWRFVVHKNVLNPFPFDVGAYMINVFSGIRAIYLGAKSKSKYQEEICKHFEGTGISIYKMKMNAQDYTLQPVLLE